MIVAEKRNDDVRGQGEDLRKACLRLALCGVPAAGKGVPATVENVP